MSENILYAFLKRDTFNPLGVTEHETASVPFL